MTIHQVCTCETCQKSSCIDPSTNITVWGRLFTTVDFKTHQQQLRHSKLKDDTYALRTPSPPATLPPPTPLDPPSGDDNCTEDMEVVQLLSVRAELEGFEDRISRLDSQSFTFVDSSLLESKSPLLKRGANRLLDELEDKMQQMTSISQLHRRSGNLLKRKVANQIAPRLSMLHSQWNSLKERKRALCIQPHAVHEAPLRLWSQLNPLLLTIYAIVSTLHLFAYLSNVDASFLLSGLKVLVEVAGTATVTPDTLSRIPSSLETLFDGLDLNPHTITYTCCPKCYSTYDPRSFSAPTPLTCTAKILPTANTPAALCGRTLFVGDTTVPVLPYDQQEFGAWLAGLVGREELAPYLGPRSVPVALPNVFEDIWDGEAVRDLKGPNGKPFLLSVPPTETRLIFGLNEDGMNPNGNRIAKKSVSVGPKYIVCFNLPPHIRYRIENIYLVGVTPGPSGPSLDEINGVLAPLVNQLLPAWKDGIFICKVPFYPQGHLYRCALLPIITDLLAGRQLGGIAWHTDTYWCGACESTSAEESLDITTWPRKTWEEHIQYATEWRDAATKELREDIYEKHRVRWSELLRLPYWDPTKFITMDSMHGFDLGLLRRHVRQIWGMDVKLEEGMELSSWIQDDACNPREISIARALLQNGRQIRRSKLSVLRHLCRESGLRYAGARAQLVQRLMDYFKENRGPETMEEKVSRLYYHSTFATIKREDTVVLLRLCESFVKDVGDVSQMTRSELYHVIQGSRKSAGVIGTTGHLVYPNPPADSDQSNLKARRPRSKSVFLGLPSLTEVRVDMENLELPPFAGRPPLYPGEKKGGKFTADQWRVFCTYLLPITLVRLLADHRDSQREEERRKFDMLVNYMDLISAIKIGVSRTQTEASIQDYETYMRRYLEKLLRLYPGTALSPYQHLSLHFGELLRRFGPNHSWRCWAFERYNGIMQKINTNNKFGQLERTMLKTFCRQQNLRALYQSHDLPETLQPLISSYQAVYISDLRGMMAQEIGTTGRQSVSGRVQLPPAQLEAVAKSAEITVPPGQLFALSLIRLKKARSLNRIFEPKQAVAFGNIFGRIQDIFAFESAPERPVVILHPFKELSSDHVSLDVFRLFPLVTGRLVYDEYEPYTMAIPLHDLEACATCPVNLNGIHRKVRTVTKWEIGLSDLAVAGQ